MEMTDSPEAFNKYMEDIDMNRLIEEKKEDSFAIPDKPISHKLHKESDNKNYTTSRITEGRSEGNGRFNKPQSPTKHRSLFEFQEFKLEANYMKKRAEQSSWESPSSWKQEHRGKERRTNQNSSFKQYFSRCPKCKGNLRECACTRARERKKERKSKTYFFHQFGACQIYNQRKSKLSSSHKLKEFTNRCNLLKKQNLHKNRIKNIQFNKTNKPYYEQYGSGKIHQYHTEETEKKKCGEENGSLKGKERSRNRSRINTERSNSKVFSEKVLMKESDEHYEYEIGQIIQTEYLVCQHIGDGGFGRVLLVRKLNSKNNSYFALKIMKNGKRYFDSGKQEVDVLEQIQHLDSLNQSKCCHLYEHFILIGKQGRQYFCMVFEFLQISLFELLKKNNYRGFSISTIQTIAKQIFQALSFLHLISITHNDLKPENILVCKTRYCAVTENNQPKQFRKRREKTQRIYYEPYNLDIKLIDFGGASLNSSVECSPIINTRQFRSPEFILECGKSNEKSDIWAIGCTLLELYTGEVLFPTRDKYMHISLINKLIGAFPTWMTNNAHPDFTQCFTHSQNNQHDVKYTFSNSNMIDQLAQFNTIYDMIHDDHGVFKDFLYYILEIDPRNRPSAEDCLRHPFFQTAFDEEFIMKDML